MLVCLAAAIAMLQANFILTTVGKTSDSFVNLDVLRFPLGILSGIGFIGAGVILRRGDLVTGVTTAATMWFVTVLGLCFGGGQLVLGLAGLAIAAIVLWALPVLEQHLPHDRSATLELVIADPEKLAGEVEDALKKARFKILERSIVYRQRGRSGALKYELGWHGKLGEQKKPAFIAEIVDREEVERLSWATHGSTTS
jgi:putative Mg2+ transporter-C (MgtC) family protein